ncbi:Thioesterase/thiol ester dehydrase-isomerase [Macrolepiota fuliginosa MF-IS2]|uniref:Thioesterase/thiol ester dehydrase-isomerase n=1 Tax=Macrolepiota fuliginosa MF-IS2 TaxID=1400762 RepID=A0A9P6C834_9AGAR|nr:Thioesterase/thiol ester dehydrase-isomerase [Macrolepiota fuliginosa MF-IS2]
MSGEANQVEHEQILTSLEVEKIEVNLYRSKSLWLPLRGRGVFGGQVISQALVSATNCVDPRFSLHSLHCYFLTSASPSTPIVYEVDRVRNGRSYVTRTVKAIQNGHVIFVMLCSFQKPESWQPSHYWPMPDVPSPEECELDEERYVRLAQREGLHPKIVEIYTSMAAERTRSPIAVRIAGEHDVAEDGTIRYMYWMKARAIPKYETPFQKCILSYLSDMYFISSAAKILGLRRGGSGPNTLSMVSTLDHTIWFYSDDFHCGDWLLYVMHSPRTGSGRGVVHGRIYTRDGKLVAVTSQEGVVRADVRGPQTTNQSEPPSAKL